MTASYPFCAKELLVRKSGGRLACAGLLASSVALFSCHTSSFAEPPGKDGISAPAGPVGSTPPSAPTPPPAASSSAAVISGHVARSEKLAARKPVDEVLFVMARDAATGRIVAVCQLQLPAQRSWPVAFTLQDDRLVAGASVRLSARLDQDGNATTKEPGDEVGAVKLALVVPETDVTLTLDEVL